MIPNINLKTNITRGSTSNSNSKSRNASTASRKSRSEAMLEARGPHWEPERPASLTLTSRSHHARTGKPLKTPVVSGTLKLSGCEVTLENAHALGTLAYMACADSIKYVPSYVSWDVLVEEVSDEELRAMLEPEDAMFIAQVRDGFLQRLNSGSPKKTQDGRRELAPSSRRR